MSSDFNLESVIYEDEKIEDSSCCDESDDDENYFRRISKRFLILAIPKNLCFETLCDSKSPTQCLRYLADEIDLSSPRFKLYLKQILQKFSSVSLNKTLENRALLIEIVHATRDKELVLMYINKIFAHGSDYSDTVYGLPKGNEKEIAKLFQSFPWGELKKIVEEIMGKVSVLQYERWMDVFSLSGILDIANKIIGLSLQEIRCQVGKKINKVSLWDKIFESIHKNDDLSRRWLNEITECQNILSDFEVMTALCDHLLFDDPFKLSSVFNSFVVCVKVAITISDSSNSLVPMVSSVVTHTLQNSILFKGQLENMFSYMISKGLSSIITKILHRICKQSEELGQTEGFKMIVDTFFDQLYSKSADFEEKARLAEIVLRGNLSDMEVNIAKYVKSCRTLKDSKSVCKLIKKIFDFCTRNKPLKLTNMVDGLLGVLIEKCTKDYAKIPAMVPQLMMKLFDQGDFYAAQIDKLFENKKFTDNIKSRADQFLSYLEYPKKIPETKSLKKLLRYLMNVVSSHKATLQFIKILFKESFHEDVALEFISSSKFKVDYVSDFYYINGGKTRLQKLIDDLEKDHSSNSLYGEMLLVRLKDLKRLQNSGCPKFTWEQPEAYLWDNNPQIERFLRSDEVTFVYRNQRLFRTINDARRFLQENCSYYSFTGIARKNQEGIIEIVLQKERDGHKKKVDRYFALMTELEDLEEKLSKSYPEVYSKLGSLKRPLESAEKDSNIPNKMQLLNEC